MNTGSRNTYKIVCHDKDGKLRWEEEVCNLVTNEGLDDVLDKYYKGSSYNAAHYLGLKGTGTIAAADTLSSHGGWSEVTDYTGNRKAITLGTVALQSVDNSASKAEFTFDGSATVAGILVATVATGSAGILYAAADFAASRAVIADDVLKVTCTFTQGNI